MSPLHVVLVAAVACGSTTCPYHNEDFGFSVVFPKDENTTVCVPDAGGWHGPRLLFRRDADCERLEEPGIGISGFYNTFYRANAEVAARELCGDGVVTRTHLKIDGFPVAVCRGPDELVKGWFDVSYIVVDSAPREDGGMIFTVGLVAPPDDIPKYERTLIQLLKAIKLPHLSAGSHGH
jgi:hypothetical protein